MAGEHDFRDALVLTGPTGSGKSALALELAEELGCEIVAMDSMTLYRGMDIGTAKPTQEERLRIPHHLIDVLDPSESGSVAWWLGKAAEACEAIRKRGKRPLFVGGTPLYLKALFHGLFDSPLIDPAIRPQLEAEAESSSREAMHRRLAEVDPVSAAKLHPNDSRRVIRALEVFLGTGKPFSSFQGSWNANSNTIPTVVLEWPRDELYDRIDRRVLAMLDAGWLDEVQRLSETSLSPEAKQAVGYRELLSHLRGECVLEEVIERIQIRTRQFAKRQLTWFRSWPECVPVPFHPHSDLAERVKSRWGLAPEPKN